MGCKCACGVLDLMSIANVAHRASIDISIRLLIKDTSHSSDTASIAVTTIQPLT